MPIYLPDNPGVQHRCMVERWGLFEECAVRIWNGATWWDITTEPADPGPTHTFYPPHIQYGGYGITLPFRDEEYYIDLEDPEVFIQPADSNPSGIPTMSLMAGQYAWGMPQVLTADVVVRGLQVEINHKLEPSVPGGPFAPNYFSSIRLYESWDGFANQLRAERFLTDVAFPETNLGVQTFGGPNDLWGVSAATMKSTLISDSFWLSFHILATPRYERIHTVQWVRIHVFTTTL